MSTFTEWIAAGRKHLPDQYAQSARPATWSVAPYDRAVVFAAIVNKSGGPLAVVDSTILARLKAMQAAWNRWQTAIGPDGETARRQLQAEWEAKVEAGQPYDPLGFPSDLELTRRHTLRATLAQQKHRAIALEARPLAVAILKALPALADKLTPAAEQDEAADKRKDEARGQTWMPSEWLRQLWQTPKEVEAQIERVQRADTDWEMSPAEMLGNAIQL